MAHAGARTNLFARKLILERVAAGWPPAHVAEQLSARRSTSGWAGRAQPLDGCPAPETKRESRS